MTKRLILIRHAKSGWDDPLMDDHERILTDRGRKASAKIGIWLSAKGYLATKYLVSDAARTRETAELLIAATGVTPEVTFKPALYHASPDTILSLASRETADTLAIIGHNPGIGMLAHSLVKTRPAHRRFSDYPTCATTVIEFKDDIRLGHGDCLDFTVPRELG